MRFILTAILSFSVLAQARPSFADEQALSDAKLMEALRIIAEQEARWTAQDWETFVYRAAKYALYSAAVLGPAAAFYYFQLPKGFALKPLNVGDSLSKLKAFAANHGGKVVIGVAGPLLITNAVNRFTALSNVSEAERLRTAATPDARVYRTHLRHFFKLSLSEQFLVARQDPAFVEDLFRIARWIEVENARGDGPARISPADIPAPPAG